MIYSIKEDVFDKMMPGHCRTCNVLRTSPCGRKTCCSLPAEGLEQLREILSYQPEYNRQYILLSKEKQKGRPPCPHHYVHLPARQFNRTPALSTLRVPTGNELGLRVRDRPVSVAVAVQDQVPWRIPGFKAMLARVELEVENKFKARAANTIVPAPIVPPMSSDDDDDDDIFYVRAR